MKTLILLFILFTSLEASDTTLESIKQAVTEGMEEYYNKPIQQSGDSLESYWCNTLDTIRVLDTGWVYWPNLVGTPGITYRDSTVRVCDTMEIEISNGERFAMAIWTDEEFRYESIYYLRQPKDSCLFCPDSLSQEVYFKDSVICRDSVVLEVR